jgi:hypothetical protein
VCVLSNTVDNDHDCVMAMGLGSSTIRLTLMMSHRSAGVFEG